LRLAPRLHASTPPRLLPAPRAPLAPNPQYKLKGKEAICAGITMTFNEALVRLDAAKSAGASTTAVVADVEAQQRLYSVARAEMDALSQRLAEVKGEAVSRRKLLIEQQLAHARAAAEARASSARARSAAAMTEDVEDGDEDAEEWRGEELEEEEEEGEEGEKKEAQAQEEPLPTGPFALHRAVEKGASLLKRVLEAAAAKPAPGIDDVEPVGLCLSPLALAASLGRAECVKLLVAAGAKLYGGPPDKYGASALHHA